MAALRVEDMASPLGMQGPPGLISQEHNLSLRKYIMGRRVLILVGILSVPALIVTLAWPWAAAAQAQEESDTSLLLRPKNAEFVVLTKCAACHYDQYKDWKGSEHNMAYEILPLKYRNDATCLECHTTGKIEDVSSHQFGVSCQACHGPGEAHANFALRFVNEIITEEGLQTLRDKIQRLDMHQCVKCHVSKAHKKHPPYEGERAIPRTDKRQSTSFFQSVHRGRT